MLLEQELGGKKVWSSLRAYQKCEAVGVEFKDEEGHAQFTKSNGIASCTCFLDLIFFVLTLTGLPKHILSWSINAVPTNGRDWTVTIFFR